MGVKPKMRDWISGVALGLALLGLGAVSFAQFQVNQRTGWNTVAWPLTANAPLSEQLQQGLKRETAANINITGQFFHVIAPSLGLDKTFAAGQGVLPTDDIRVASNIKPFVAASALKLVETGQLSLDASISPYLTAPTRQILEKSGRPLSSITLRHLLTHSSGIGDYGSSRVFQLLGYVPTAFGMAWHWTPRDQIWFGANFTAKAPVGQAFDYSDTNYLLASEMIAVATGKPNAGIAVRALLDWPALGAWDAFWEFYEPTPQGTRIARHFWGAVEDTYLDVSFDQFGGGGLVMDMHDLAHAHRAIVRGDVFKNPVATAAIMQAAGKAKGANGYGMGISPMTILGETCWSHGGRWGTIALSCPALDLTVARSWGQSNAGPDQVDPTGPIVGLVRLAQEKR
jgi:D-alanyl-D-alanine carboxypeptidase